MLGSVSAIVTSSSFLILYEKWLTFFEDLETCKKFGTPRGYEKIRNNLNRFCAFLTLYIFAGVILYGVVSLKETSYCKQFNEDHGLNEICGLFSPLVLPFDGNKSFARIPIFGLQLCLAMSTLIAAIVVFFLPCEGVEMLSAHISLLKYRFKNVFQVANDAERRDRLRFCLRCHTDILSLCQHLSILGKYTCGNLCITCALVFGCIGNLILKSKPLSGTIYLTVYVAALFLVCHGGQTLMDETLSISYAVYDSKWYEGDAKIMKDIIFILARSQRPITMNALPLGVTNYSLFLMIMKTSYSYFTLLSQNT